MRFTRTRWPQEGHCFVIMPFGKKPLRDSKEFDWDKHYEIAIAPTVESVGMIPVRADEIYGGASLMERVWNGIQEAEIVVADLTGRSPNVLYEIGLAHVIGKRLLVATMYPDDVPADLSEFVQIRYSTESLELLKFTRDLAKNLTAARNEPAVELLLLPLPGPGGGLERISAIVLAVSRDFATIEAQDGRRGFLAAEDYSWTRRRADLTRLLRVGQKLDGAFVVDMKGQLKYSVAAVDENPWPRMENEFPVGKSFQGIVSARSSGIGAFVSIRYGIDGLLPESLIPRGVSVESGSLVEVVPVRIDTQQREVELRLVRVIESTGRWAPVSHGDRRQGRVVRVVPDRGFILVEVAEGTTGLMPVAKMSQELRRRLESGAISEGETLLVEVTAVDERNRRITLQDLPASSLGTEKPITDAPDVPAPQPAVDERDTRITLQDLPSNSLTEKPVTDAPVVATPEQDAGQTTSQGETTTE